MVRRSHVRGVEKRNNVMWKSHQLEHFRITCFQAVLTSPLTYFNYKDVKAVWSNIICKYLPLQFHLCYHRQHCEKPLQCFPWLRNWRQQGLTSLLFSSLRHYSSLSELRWERTEEAGMRVTMQDSWCYLVVCQWLENVKLWLRALQVSDLIYGENTRSAVYNCFVDESCVYMGMAGTHCLPQQHCFYGDHVTVCAISLPQTCQQPNHQRVGDRGRLHIFLTVMMHLPQRTQTGTDSHWR